jgi:hypothetical protein
LLLFYLGIKVFGNGGGRYGKILVRVEVWEIGISQDEEGEGRVGQVVERIGCRL